MAVMPHSQNRKKMKLLLPSILLGLCSVRCDATRLMGPTDPAVGNAESRFDCSTLDCDDGNSLTTDTCDSSSGCENTCDDGNACTREAFVDGVCQYVDESGDPYDCSNEDGSDCLPGLIDCSDGNPFTTDVCVPSTGCRHFSFVDFLGNLVGLDSTLAELEAEETIFYEEQSTLTENQILEILDWIKLEVTQLRTPFCWRRSYGRGVGEPLRYCPPGKERIGLLCYTPCKPGYSRQGTLDCHQVNIGFFCGVLVMAIDITHTLSRTASAVGETTDSSVGWQNTGVALGIRGVLETRSMIAVCFAVVNGTMEVVNARNGDWLCTPSANAATSLLVAASADQASRAAKMRDTQTSGLTSHV